MRGFLLKALIFLLVPLAGDVSAETDIPGGSIINQTWTVAGSPYVVQGDVVIPEGSQLVIEAGASIRFESFDVSSGGLDSTRIELTVLGSLYASGSENQPIRFRSDGAGSANDWFGLIIEPSANEVVMSHVVISDTREAIRSGAGAVTALSDVHIMGSGLWDINLTQDPQPSLMNELSLSRVSGSLTVGDAVNLHHNGSAGLIDGDLELSANATYSITLMNVAVFDQLEVTGSVTLGAGLVIDTEILTASMGDQFLIINNNSPGAVSGTFAGLPEGASFSQGQFLFRITYADGDGNDVVLTVLQDDIFADSFE